MQRKKVCIIGNDGVGKTSIIVRKIKNNFSTSYLPTLGCDFYEWKPDPELFIYFWDIAAQSSFKQMQKHYLSFSHLTLIVLDINRISEEFIIPWIETSKNNAGDEVPIILVLNKIDLMEDIEKLKEIKESLNKKYNYELFLTSAKSGENIKELFERISKLLLNQEKPYFSQPNSFTCSKEDFI